MKRLMIGLMLSLGMTATAASKKENRQPAQFDVTAPEVEMLPADGEFFSTMKKAWSESKRKVASETTFSEGELSKDYKVLRDEWLKVKNADQLEALLKASNEKYATYSDDVKYFLAHFHVALPLRGLIWRMRPLFETGTGLVGNKSTHAMAVQMVRSAGTGLKIFFPTEQWDAGFAYLTVPSAEMSKSDQFHSVSEFQKFLAQQFVPALYTAANRMTEVLKKNPTAVFVWDNKMAYGTGSFVDGANRFIGYGPAEMNFSIAMMYQAAHDALVFTSYNQDALMDVAKDLGRNYGIDAITNKGDFGITDEERHAVFARAASRQWLQLRPNYGEKAMKSAFSCLANATTFAFHAHEYLQGKKANPALALNPQHFQDSDSVLMARGVKQMMAAIKGEVEIRDIITGETVRINVPAFYNNPPQNLFKLSANRFEKGSARDLAVANKNGEQLMYRDYFHGRAKGWDNNEWAKYVPSAQGKDDGYMANARRVIHRGLGASMVFGAPDLFVR